MLRTKRPAVDSWVGISLAASPQKRQALGDTLRSRDTSTNPSTGLILIVGAYIGGCAPSPRPDTSPQVATLDAAQRAAVREAFAQAVAYSDSDAPRCLVLADSTARFAPDAAMLAALSRNRSEGPVFGPAQCPRTYAVPGGYEDPTTSRRDDSPAPLGYRDPVVVTIWTPQVTDGLIAPFRIQATQGTGGRTGECERARSASGLSCNLTGTLAY